ncbi:MAG: CDP-glycerol glycerophosphotransferase family protein [Nanoarchaeota archaeon]
MKVLAITYDTGVANGLFRPISKLNEDKKLETIILSEGPSRNVFDAQQIKYKTLQDYGLSEINEGNVDAVIDKENPDIILTGFSEGIMLEKYSISNAKSRKITSFTVLEGYTNYLKIVSDNELKNPFMYMPDYICIMDNFILEEMLKLKFDKDKLILTGNPYFDDLIALKNSFNEGDLRKIRNELNIDENGYLITFFSQAIKKVIDKGSDNPSRGYNELTVLSMLESSLHELNIENLNLLVKLHPKEDLESTQSAFSGKLNKVIFDKEYNSRKAMVVSDLVTGVFSTALVESVYLDKNAVSIQPNITVQDTLVMNKLGLVVPVYNQEDLKPTLEKLVYDKNFKEELRQKRNQLKLDGKATERVVKEIYKLLNIN